MQSAFYFSLGMQEARDREASATFIGVMSHVDFFRVVRTAYDLCIVNMFGVLRKILKSGYINKGRIYYIVGICFSCTTRTRQS